MNFILSTHLLGFFIGRGWVRMPLIAGGELWIHVLGRFFGGRWRMLASIPPSDGRASRGGGEAGGRAIVLWCRVCGKPAQREVPNFRWNSLFSFWFLFCRCCGPNCWEAPVWKWCRVSSLAQGGGGGNASAFFFFFFPFFIATMEKKRK